MFSCLQILEAFLWFVLITLLNVTLIILTLSVSRLLNLLLRLVAFLLFLNPQCLASISRWITASSSWKRFCLLNLPFKALMFLTLMRPSLVLFLVLWLKLVKDFLKVRCRLALLPFLISCLIWLDLVASLPLIKERILVIILLLHFLSLMLGSVLVLMLPLLVWLTPDLRIKKSLLKCNWTIRKRLPRCKMRLKKRLLAFSRRLHARIRKTRYMHKMRCLLINRRSLLLALRLLWKTPIFPSNSRFPRL